MTDLSEVSLDRPERQPDGVMRAGDPIRLPKKVTVLIEYEGDDEPLAIVTEAVLPGAKVAFESHYEYKDDISSVTGPIMRRLQKHVIHVEIPVTEVWAGPVMDPPMPLISQSSKASMVCWVPR